MYLVCGEALFDLFSDDKGSADRFKLEACVGGSPFNVAIGISRLGSKSALLTGISDDILGQRLISVLERERVSTQYLVTSGNRTTLSLVAVNQQGHPDYVFYGLGSADCSLVPEDMPILPQEISALHFGSYSLVVKPVADAFSTLLENCGERFVSVDPNVRLNVEPELSVWRERVSAYAERANLIKVSAEDIDALYPGVAVETKAVEWMEQGVDLVVVTDGASKVLAWTRSGLSASVTPPEIEVSDTVGAGDSFQAALLHRLSIDSGGNPLATVKGLTEARMYELLAYCSKAAALTCGRRGADLPVSKDMM